MRLIVTLILSLSLLTACSNKPEEVVAPVPTAPIDNFDQDTRDIVQMIGSTVNETKPISDEQNKLIEAYFSKYKNNPRLDVQQNLLVTNIGVIQTMYGMYLFKKDSKDADTIKLANKSIEMVYDHLKRFEGDGYVIK